MTKEVRDELVAAFNSGWGVPPDEPESALDRLRAAWVEASDVERAIFAGETF
jgi:hypothetical protein